LISAQQRPRFCFMPPESWAAGRARRGEPGVGQKLDDSCVTRLAFVVSKGAEETAFSKTDSVG